MTGWLVKKTCGIFQPIRSKIKTNFHLLVQVFSCQVSATCICLEFWLDNSFVCVLGLVWRGTLGICGVAHFFMRCCSEKNPSLRWSQALPCVVFAFKSLQCSVKINYLRYSHFHNFWTIDFPETFLYRRGISNFSTQLCSHFSLIFQWQSLSKNDPKALVE